MTRFNRVFLGCRGQSAHKNKNCHVVCEWTKGELLIEVETGQCFTCPTEAVSEIEREGELELHK